MENYAVLTESWKTLHGLGNQSNANKLQNPDCYFKISSVIGRTNVILLLGRGYVFESEDEATQKAWKEIEDSSYFLRQVEKMIYTISVYGEAGMGYDILEDGSFKVFVVNPRWQAFWQHSYEDLVALRFMVEKNTATANKFLQVEKWSADGTVEREFYWADGNPDGKKGKITVADMLSKIPDIARLPKKERWDTKFESIPFVKFNNFSHSNLPDWDPVKGQIELMNRFTKRYIRDLKVNKNRLVMNMPASDKEALLTSIKTEDSNNDKEVGTDVLVNTKPTGDENKLAEVVQAQMNFQDYTKAFRDHLEITFTLMGYKIADQDGQSNRTTATEVSISNTRENHTILRKRTNIQFTMNKFIRKMLISKGIKDPQFTWKLSQMTLTDERTLTDTLILQLGNGLMSRVEAISELRNISSTEAEQLMKKIDKEEKFIVGGMEQNGAGNSQTRQPGQNQNTKQQG